MGCPGIIAPYLYESFHPSYNWFLGPPCNSPFSNFQVSYLKVKSACLMAYSRNFFLISGASNVEKQPADKAHPADVLL